MKKRAPMKVSSEVFQDMAKQLGVQEIPKGIPKSADPVNFPVWNIPVGKNVFIYVPNHTVQDEDGVLRLRMDRALSHAVTVGKNFYTYRCTSGIVNEALGYDGSCPFCDAVSEPWDLANLKIKSKCEAQGLDPQDTENSTVKSIRSAEFSDRALKDAEVSYTFPIVVFETQNDDGKTLLKDENGNYIFKVYWYRCSETTWQKWVDCLNELNEKNEDADENSEPLTHPGGQFFLLKYIYATKNNAQQNARDAARNMTVNFRNMKNSEKVRATLDKLTEGWTPAKAAETVLANQFYSLEDMEEITNEALEGTRKMAALYSANEGIAGLPGGENTTGGFQLSKPEDQEVKGIETDADKDVGSAPIETDMDME